MEHLNVNSLVLPVLLFYKYQLKTCLFLSVTEMISLESKLLTIGISGIPKNAGE